MFIEFTDLSVSNFLSYGKTPTEIKLNASPTTLLLGESGSGKSSIPNALSFVLFDDTFRNVQKHQLVNSENGKNCVVQVSFKIGADQYTIKRGIKPNILEVTKNGNTLGRDSKVADLQSHIEQNILKFNKKTFNQIISLAEVNFIPFMLLPAKDRRIFVEKVLGVEIFSVMNALLKVRIKESGDLCEELERKISNIEEVVEIHQGYVEKTKSENKSKIADHESEIKKALKQKEGLETELKALRDGDLKTLTERAKERERIQSTITETDLKLRKLDLSLDQEEEKRSNIQKNDTCPTCEQKFPKALTTKKLNEIDERITKLQESRARGEEVKKNLIAESERFEGDEDKLAELEEKETDLEVRIGQCTEKARFHKREIAKYDTDSAENIKEIEDKIQRLEEEKSEVRQRLKQALDEREIQNVAAQLLKDEGIKAEIVRNYIPKINSYVNRFLDGMGYDVSFHLNHEFEEQIRTRGKESFSYNSFSAGQRQRIDLALLFTWRAIARARNSVNTNLLFLDEVVDSHLNIEATESVVDMFSGKLFQGTNVFVISHKGDITPKFSKILHFELRNGFTRIT